MDQDLKQLAEMPGMGPSRTFINPRLAGVRSWPVSGFENYLMFYRPTEHTLEFLRLIHGARDIDTAMDM